MHILLISAALLLALILFTHLFVKTDPQKLANLIRLVLGCFAAVLSIPLAVRLFGGFAVPVLALAAAIIYVRWISGRDIFGGAERGAAADPSSRTSQDGSGGAGQGQTYRARGSGIMTVEEACRVLRVAPSASADEIKAAHRSKMKTCHPDHGGSDFEASRINQAKDVLMERAAGR